MSAAVVRDQSGFGELFGDGRGRPDAAALRAAEEAAAAAAERALGDPISAEMHTDDHEASAGFDARPWFEQASDANIIELAQIDFGGDYAADSVARFCEDLDEELRGAFAYHDSVAGGPNETGFECHIEAAAAVEWVRAARPHLLGAIGEQ